MVEKTPKAKAKVERVRKVMLREEPDRIPLWEIYWTDFLRGWREELGLSSDADPYYYYDLDLNVATPNLDPHIT